MRFRTAAWMVLVFAGCGQVTSPGVASDAGGTEVDASVTGGEPDAALPDDAALPPPSCLWSELTADDFATLNGPDVEWSPSFTGDGRAVYYTVMPADESFAPDIWDAVREEADQPFGAPRLVGELSEDVSELEIEISPTDDEIFFLRDTGPNILTAARTEEGAFGGVQDTGLLGTSPTLSGDGLDLYYLDPSDGSILHAARESIEDGFGAPDVVGRAVNFRWIDVSADELRLLLSGGEGETVPAIAIAERESVDQDFGAAAAAGEALEGRAFPAPGEAAWDASGTQLVVSAQRENGNFDLFFSRCE